MSLFAVIVVVPAPRCTSVPSPLTFWSSVYALERFATSVAPAATVACVPLPSVPVVPPLPTSSVPALIVVRPV